MGYKKNVPCNKSSSALELVAQRCGGCPIPAVTPGQAGLGSDQPDLFVGVPILK